MKVPLPSRIAACNCASLRFSCQVWLVKSGISGKRSRAWLPVPSAPWHFTQCFWKSSVTAEVSAALGADGSSAFLRGKLGGLGARGLGRLAGLLAQLVHFILQSAEAVFKIGRVGLILLLLLRLSLGRGESSNVRNQIARLILLDFPSKGRHVVSFAFEDTCQQLGVRSLRLPRGVGEIGDVRHGIARRTSGTVFPVAFNTMLLEKLTNACGCFFRLRR